MIAGEIRHQYITDYLAAIPETHHADANGSRTTFDNFATQLHLINPSLSARELSAETGLSLDDIKALYKDIRHDEVVQCITNSSFYPRKMMTRFARDTIKDWSQDPDYGDKLLSGEPVASRILEVHATRGTCDYTCTMCLWSDKEYLTYRKLGLSEFGLMNTSNWIEVFQQSRDLGTKKIVFSGGGEPLLNKDLFSLSEAVRGLDMQALLYTNGFNLKRAADPEWEELLQMEQVRFSIHSPTEDIYNQIVAMPPHINALPTVSSNIQEFIERRKASGGNVRIGIGFVTQALNYKQIESMVEFAKELGVDFINLRQDEVDVTRGLSVIEQKDISKQLSFIRDRTLAGEYGEMDIDISDDMTALANGIEQTIRRVGNCSVKGFRPAISPFGVVAPCDLRAEPRFSDPAYKFGNVRRQPLPLVIERASKQQVDAGCVQCMPSGKTINAIITKLIKDNEDGISYLEQPFAQS